MTSTFRMDRELPRRPLPNSPVPKHVDLNELQTLLDTTLKSQEHSTHNDPNANLTSDLFHDDSPRPYTRLESGLLDRCLDTLSFRQRSSPNFIDHNQKDVLASIQRLQKEVDSIRFYIDDRRKEQESCLYEKIESKSSVDYRQHKANKSLRHSLYVYTTDRGLFNLRKLFDPKLTTIKKLLWILVFLCLSALLANQIRDRVLLFIKSETDTRIDVSQNTKVEFPSVTICNLNLYRLTSLAALGLYQPLQRLNRFYELSRDSKEQLSYIFSKKNMTYKDFLHKVSHTPENLVYTCRWKTDTCTVRNFTASVTDHGLCYTFTPTADRKFVSDTGPTSGLSLLLNIEQYEYVLGQRSAVGAMVAFHEPHQLPNMLLDGIYIGSGAHTTIGLRKSQIIENETSGRCMNNVGKEGSDCSHQCWATVTLQRCGCLLPIHNHVDSQGRYRACTIRDYFFCAKEFKGKNLDEGCGCRSSCTRSLYEAETSQSGMSSYVSESEAKLLKNSIQIKTNFNTARNLYHRLDNDIYSYDKYILRNITVGLNTFLANFRTFKNNIFHQESLFKEKFKRVVAAVKDVNKTVSGTSENFVKSTHLAFISFAVNLRTQILGILSRKPFLTKLFRPTRQRFNSEVRNITTKIQKLIATNSRATNVITEHIINGIKLLKKEIVNGYGQKYLEFREFKELYNNTTTKVYNSIMEVEKTLLKDYKLLLKLLEVSDLNNIRKSVDKMLNEFFTSIYYVLENPVKEMISRLDSLFKLYVDHTGSIKNLVARLNDVNKKFSNSSTEIKTSLTRLRVYINSLESKVKSLKLKLTDVKENYNNKVYLKSEVAETLIAGETDNIVQNTETLVDGIKRDIDNVMNQGRILTDAVETIAPRIADMTDISYSELATLLKEIRYNTLDNVIDDLGSNLELHLSTLTTFRWDLKEYIKSNKIDSSFYQSNFVQVDIYYKDIAVKTVTTFPSYTTVDFLCDIGGSLALYLGVSILTFFQSIEFMFAAARTLLSSHVQ